MSMLEKTSQSNLIDKSSTPMNSLQSEVLKRRLLWYGIFLCTLAFIVGLFIPLYANPRAGLATHVLGITEGLFLVVIGFCYPLLRLPLWLARVNFWMLVVSAYVGMLSEFLGATFGLNRMLVVTAMGLPESTPWLETSFEIVIKGISVFILISCFIVLFGLRETKSNSSSQS